MRVVAEVRRGAGTVLMAVVSNLLSLITVTAFPDTILSSPRYKPSISLFLFSPTLAFSLFPFPFSPTSPDPLSFAAPYILLSLSTTTVFVAMVRVLCIASLALAAVSAVSGHVIRHRRGVPQGWDAALLQVHSLLVVYVKLSFSASLAVLSAVPRTIPSVGLSE